MTQDHARKYQEDGYFIVDDAVDAEALDELGRALRRVADKVRSGAVIEHQDRIETDGEGQEPHIVSALMAPEYGEAVFSEYLVSGPVQKYARLIVGNRQRLGWISGFASTQIAGYDCGWHRDTGGRDRDASYEVEMETLRTHRKNMLKFHLAVEDDPCLWLIPGSHIRYRTDEEQAAMAGDRKGELAGAVQIDLQRGQTVFWNGNTIHRGLAPQGMTERWNLTGSLVRHDGDREALDRRFEWRLPDDVRGSLPPGILPLYDNWRWSVSTPSKNLKRR